MVDVHTLRHGSNMSTLTNNSAIPGETSLSLSVSCTHSYEEDTLTPYYHHGCNERRLPGLHSVEWLPIFEGNLDDASDEAYHRSSNSLQLMFKISTVAAITRWNGGLIAMLDDGDTF